VVDTWAPRVEVVFRLKAVRFIGYPSGWGRWNRALLISTYSLFRLEGQRRDIRDDTRFGEDDLDDWIGSI
jgi:hypothetical protein